MKALLVLAFLFLKTGEKFATQEAAGPTVGAFTAAVAAEVGGVAFEPRVLNDPAAAVAYCAAKKPAAGIVTPGFYFAHAKALGMEPLLETRRQGVPAERYVVVVRKDAGDGLASLQGKVIATTLAAEERYVLGVILQGKVGNARLKPVTDVEGAAFDLVEKAKNGADAVLLEEATWTALAKDEELGPKLKRIHQSAELPFPLVVAFRPNVGALDLARLKAVLQAMDRGAAGKQALGSIRVERFEEVDVKRLQQAEGLFHGK